MIEGRSNAEEVGLPLRAAKAMSKNDDIDDPAVTDIEVEAESGGIGGGGAAVQEMIVGRTKTSMRENDIGDTVLQC